MKAKGKKPRARRRPGGVGPSALITWYEVFAIRDSGRVLRGRRGGFKSCGHAHRTQLEAVRCSWAPREYHATQVLDLIVCEVSLCTSYEVRP